MKKVLVCGTGFGQYYLKAIQSLANEVELVGILSRGSKQSAQWADLLSVPLYTAVDQLDSVEIDIACVVVKSEIVGGSGTSLAEYFLKRGVSVFQEHPVHYETYAALVKLAKKNHCYYYMNTFYPFLQSVNVFLKTIAQLKAEAKINYIRAECGIQVLFPMIDILGRTAGNMSSFQIEKDGIDTNQRPFAVVRGTIGGIPFMLLIKNEMDVQNVESNIALLHQMNVNTSCGNCTLTDVHGQVIWTPVIHESLKSGEENQTFSHIPVQQSLIDNREFTMENIFDTLWPESIRRSLTEFIKKIDPRDNMAATHQHYLCVCKAWNEIGTLLGAYHPVTYEITGPKALQLNGEVEI